MKRILLLAAVVVAALCAKAQNENYFDLADVDANGWLWFDTQAKIDKYIGEEDDLSKKIWLVYAGYEDEELGENPLPYASPTVKGAGPTGELGESGCRTGAIVLCPSSGISQETGGAIMLRLPSCLDFALNLSSEYTMLAAVYGGVGAVETVDLQMVRGFTLPIWNMWLSRDPQYTFANIHLIQNNNNGFCLESQNAMTACFRNCQSKLLYVHGIKVMVKAGDGGSKDSGTGDDDENAIKAIMGDGTQQPCYNLQGQAVKTLGRGVYIQGARKVLR